LQYPHTTAIFFFVFFKPIDGWGCNYQLEECWQVDRGFLVLGTEGFIIGRFWWIRGFCGLKIGCLWGGFLIVCTR